MTSRFFLFSLSLVAASAATPTFHKDVLPVLQKNCQSCHRAGEIGPMAFTDYKGTRPFAKAIRQAVSTRKMPPWFADPSLGHWSNDRSISQKEIDTLLAWADGGAPEGDPKDAPAPVEWTQGWRISKPDHVVEAPSPFPIPASGVVDYHYIVVPIGLTEDRWVQAVEVRPSDSARSAVHHIIAYLRTPDSKWLRGEAQPGVPFLPPKADENGRPRQDIGGAGNMPLSIYSPGHDPDVWKPGQAKLIPAGSDIVFQLHYTPSGKAVEDKPRVGMVFAKGPVTERVLSLNVVNFGFKIPPGDPNYKVDASVTFRNDGTILNFFPHLHLRGKAFEYRLLKTDGTVTPLLKVNNYNFNWQLTYNLQEPLKVQKGDKLEASAWFDNSPNNPWNPDPKATVRWGEQSFEEMMLGYFDLLIDARLDLRSWYMGKKATGD